MQKKSSYPIDEILPELKASLLRHASVVLQAPPGSGKTTRVAPALLDFIGPEKGRILLLEPRRIAAVSAARWMAKTLGEEIGQTLGYSIRFDSRVSKRTRIEVITEGVLTRRILTNPDLSGVAMVIFDEFHERNLQSDLALALCLDIRRALREDLKILVMSATLDTGPISDLLDGAPIITAKGIAYPVEERYLGDKPDEPITKRVSDTVIKALGETSGDILAFLPGGGEIRATADRLAEAFDSRSIKDVSIHPLYGDLPFEAQERAIVPGGVRKIVLATNIAETSLTIEGVGVVVDGGLTRRPEYDPATGMNRLATVAVSKAQAAQRAGRAGRLGPGVCYRCYSAHTFSSFIAFAPPEIAISDLAGPALDLAAWGVRNPATLLWLDEPPAAAWRIAHKLLEDLGALDAAGLMTDVGLAMARLPVHPRLGRLMIKAAEIGLPSLGADLASLLSERDVLRFSSSASLMASGGYDLSDRLALLRRWRKDKKAPPESDPYALRAADAIAGQLRRLIKSKNSDFQKELPDSIARLLLCAFPDRVAKKRDDRHDLYLLRSGRGVKLSAKSLAAKSDYIVAPVIDKGNQAQGIVHLAEPLSEHSLRKELAGRIKTIRRLEWNKPEGRIIAVLEERLESISISAKPIQPTPDEIAQVLCDAVRSKTAQISFSRQAKQLQARVRLMRKAFPDEHWPDLSEDALLAAPQTWLWPRLSGVRSAADLAALDIVPVLTDILTRQQQRLLDQRAPLSIAVPSGHTIAIDYVSGDHPVLAVKLQEMFGLAETPFLASGRVPLLLHLLSPAGRPVAVTRDLKAFWNTGYSQVKKELRGRYPKHPWPDDPLSATPTRRTKGRARQRD